MLGSIAQIIALTVHGNAMLQNRTAVDSAEFQARNSTFRFCESVSFVEAAFGSVTRKESVYAESPRKWFERLKKETVNGLRIVHAPSRQQETPDRILVAFAGNGKLFIQAPEAGSSRLWQSRWVVGDRSRKDSKIWRVSYLGVLNEQLPAQGPPEDLDQLRFELKQCLERLAQFSRSQNLEAFTKVFEIGIEKLDSPHPLADVYHPDIAPAGILSLSASQLLGSAQAAWVFGGMGSWNDVGFQGGTQALYERLSEDLYQLLNRALVAAANSSAPD